MRATQMDSGEQLWSTDEWFQLFFDVFEPNGNIWESSDGAVRLPYVLGTDRIGRFRVPCAFSATNFHSARFDSVGTRPVAATDVRQMMDELGVPTARFDFVREDARLTQAKHGASRAGLSVRVKEIALSPCVDCSGSFEHWWESRGSHRKTWARRERGLLNRDGAQFSVVSERADVADVLDEVFAVEASGWKGEGGTAIRQSGESREFYSELAYRGADLGVLRLFLLSLDSEIIAFQFNILSGGVLDMLKIGYLDGIRKKSPGQALQLQILRWAFASPDVDVFNMLGATIHPDETKLRFATEIESLYRLHFFRPSPRGIIAWGRHKALPGINARIRNLRAQTRG